ncbi:MAG: biotin--[acetyl-CoA-carboxylase] ligase [bacterium]
MALLSLLSEQEGEFIPSWVLRERLRLTEKELSEAVLGLRLGGYVINGSFAKGYRLGGRPDLLLPTEVLPLLRTERLGRNYVYLPTVDSTNDLAKQLARAGAVDGTLIVAETQTGGRGRLGRSWASPPASGIWLSLILRPELSPAELPKITLTTAVGIARAIEAVTDLKPGIKWPNDILAEGRKICGILTEAAVGAAKTEFVIVGIGINVNTERDAFPAALRDKAASLKGILGRPVSRALLLAEMLRAVEDVYIQLLGGEFAAIRAEWCRRTVSLGQIVHVTSPAGGFSGRAIAVTPDGALIVSREDGLQVHVVTGEVL